MSGQSRGVRDLGFGTHRHPLWAVLQAGQPNFGGFMRNISVFFTVFFVFVSAFAAEPLLPMGSIYKYSYCDDSFQLDCEAAPKQLQIEVTRVEKTATNPKDTYVFTVVNEGSTYEVKIDMEMWDQHLANMMAYASEKTACEDSPLSNASYVDYSDGIDFAGKNYFYCAGGADSEFQSASVVLIPVLSPMPYSMWAGGYWPKGPSEDPYFDYGNVVEYYRPKFYMAVEYLQLMGLPYGPGTDFSAKFKLLEIK